MIMTTILAVPFTSHAADTYTISSYADLKAFAGAVNSGATNANAVLTQDITATEKDWTPIGNSSNSYTGTFDGDGHTITGLSNEDVPDKPEYAGLFGYLDTGGVVKNVHLTGLNMKASYSIGAVAGISAGTITNCCNTDAVSGNVQFIGGIVGRYYGNNLTATISNCYNTGSVTSTASGACVGGIAGQCYAKNDTAEITSCYNTGTVIGMGNNATVGGITGMLAVSDGTVEITNCYNTGDIIGTEAEVASEVGGIAGFLSVSNGTAEITNCYNVGAVTSDGSYAFAGGIAGYLLISYSTTEITNCYSAGTVTADGSYANVGGVIGLKTEGTVENCYYDSDVCDVNNGVGTALTTHTMTGTNALSNMTGFADTVWLTKANGVAVNGKNYVFYPHLKGFAYDITAAVEDWPAKAEIAVTWKEPESYKYTGSEIKPTVTAITVGGKAFDSSDYTVSCYKKIGGSWSTESVVPIDAGDYKAVIKFTSNGYENIEKAFAITQKEINITVNGNSDEKVYSGSEQTFNGTFTATSTDAGFDASKFSYSGNTSASGTTVGEYKISPVQGNCSYSDNNYNVSWTMGNPVKLTITPKPVTIKAKDQEFTYNGTAQSCSLYDVDGLVGDDSISAIVEGSITFPSESPVSNVVKSYEFTSGTAGNYSVTTQNGTLTMTKASVPITITSASQKWTYDGNAHSNNGVTVTSGNLFAGDTLVATATGSVTNVSDTANGNNTIASGYKIMHGTADVTDNYVITPVNGTLTIYPTAITITADNKETNHGTDLAELTYALTGTIVQGDDLGISLNADIDNTKPGTYTITPAWNNNQNYTATLVDGIYTVGDSPHYYGTEGDERFTCIVCGEVDDELKAKAEAADKDAADTKAANEVTEKINALPEADKVTTADEKAITEAREAYDSLTDDQKAKVTPETFNKLTGDEKALADAKDAEAKAEAEAKAAAKKAAEEKAKAEFAAGVEVKAEKDGATVGWKKTKDAKRYVIYAAYCGKKCKKIKTVKGNITSFKLRKLNGKKINTKKNLKVYLVAQKKVNGKWVKLFKTPSFHVAGKKSKNTNVKKITVKKAKYTIAKGKTAKIKAKLVLVDKKKKPINHVAKFRYMSTNTAVVKVNKNGKLKAIGKGTATVYVFSNNGIPKAIKVTVK